MTKITLELSCSDSSYKDTMTKISNELAGVIKSNLGRNPWQKPRDKFYYKFTLEDESTK